MFKTETHMHVAEVSTCSKLGAEEMVKLYAEAGYKTLFITDHLQASTFRKRGIEGWKNQIDKFFSGYEVAKAAGDKLSLNIIFAAELCLNHSPHTHLLLYGIDKEFLMDCEGLLDMSFAEISAYAKSHGVTVVQAHPYRDGKSEPISTEYIDAVEAYNTNPRHENFDEQALAFAKNAGLPITGGSDAHRYEDIALGGVITECEIKTADDYARLLKAGKVEAIHQ